MMAIRDNPMAARSMGINNPIYKAVTFGISGLYTGIAGTLGAIVVQFVAPDSFTIYQSLAFLVGLVVGGVGWLPGAFVGAAFILFVPNVAEHVSQGLSGAGCPLRPRARHRSRSVPFDSAARDSCIAGGFEAADRRSRPAPCGRPR
jgi:ABC-type branched-subunit amino acid transport system permease subunit